MDFENLSDEDARELENTSELRLLFNVLSQYKHGSCNQEAAALAILQLLQPDIQIIQRRGARRQEDPLKRYEAVKNKIEKGREIEGRIAELIEAGCSAPVESAYGCFVGEKTHLEECRRLWAEYGPDPYGYAIEQWHGWKKVLRNNFKNLAKESPAKLPKVRRRKGLSRTRDK